MASPIRSLREWPTSKNALPVTVTTGRVPFTADAYSRDGRRFTVLSDERLIAFLELHAAIRRQYGKLG
jgi:hypothetical protein